MRQRENKGTVDPRGEEGILVGYAGAHLFRVWLLHRQMVITSLSVCVYEDLVDDDHEYMKSWPRGAWRRTKVATVHEDQAVETIVDRNPQFTLQDANLEAPEEPDCLDLEDFAGLTVMTAQGSSETAPLVAATVKGLPVNQKNHPAVKDSLASSEAPAWRAAMDKELSTFCDRGVLQFVDRPQGRRPITCRWVLHRKRGDDGHEVKKKARLVARGFLQRKGVDFTETSAATSRSDAWRLLLALAVQEELHVRQFNVVAAFLYGLLDEEVYVQPDDYFHDFFQRHPDLAAQVYKHWFLLLFHVRYSRLSAAAKQ